MDIEEQTVNFRKAKRSAEAAIAQSSAKEQRAQGLLAEALGSQREAADLGERLNRETNLMRAKTEELNGLIAEAKKDRDEAKSMLESQKAIGEGIKHLLSEFGRIT